MKVIRVLAKCRRVQHQTHLSYQRDKHRRGECEDQGCTWRNSKNVGAVGVEGCLCIARDVFLSAGLDVMYHGLVNPTTYTPLFYLSMRTN